MNLGFLDGGTAAHEFGHAIGLAHEHSSPFGGIQWNEPVVIATLAGPPNFWDEAKVRHLKLFGPDSETALLDEDDDSGYGLNPRITADLVAGEYFAQVRHWNQERGTGDYSIKVRQA